MAQIFSQYQPQVVAGERTNTYAGDRAPTVLRSARSCSSGDNRHSLATIGGYLVRQTYAGGRCLVEGASLGVTIQTFDGAGTYVDAVDLARSLRTFAEGAISSYAVVCAIYQDGCVSDPF